MLEDKMRRILALGLCLLLTTMLLPVAAAHHEGDPTRPPCRPTCDGAWDAAQGLIHDATQPQPTSGGDDDPPTRPPCRPTCEEWLDEQVGPILP